jgi:hypothetical protein
VCCALIDAQRRRTIVALIVRLRGKVLTLNVGAVRIASKKAAHRPPQPTDSFLDHHLTKQAIRGQNTAVEAEIPSRPGRAI